jgi:hypothetical protein
MKKLLLLAFATLTLNISAQPCFSSSVTYPAGAAPKGAVTKDFNGDTFLDIAVADQNSNCVWVLLGTGNGSFGSAVSYSSGASTPQHVAAADFNNDGKLDLAVTNAGSNNVGILNGNGNGTFAGAITWTVGAAPAGLVASDFGGDGLPDLAVANYGGGTNNTISVLQNNGSGFYAPLTYTVGNGPVCIEAADLDADGDKDLAVANYNSNNVSVLTNNGGGGFSLVASHAVSQYPQFVLAIDVDMNGAVDLLTANAGNNDMSVLAGLGGANFGGLTNYAAGGAPYCLTSTDYNVDGAPDIAILNYSSGDVTVYLNNGGGAFLTSFLFTTGGSAPYYMVQGDFNTDGQQDLATMNTSSANISVLLNSPPAANAGADQTICEGGAASLSGLSSTGSGSWSTSGSGSFAPNNTVLTAVYTPSSADVTAGLVQLSLTTTNNNGCTASTDMMQLTINANPTVTATASTNTICAGGSAAFSASGGISYSWATPGGLSCVTCANPTANPTVTTTYTVTGVNIQGCSDTAVIFLLVQSDTLSGMITDSSNNPVSAGVVYIFVRNPSNPGVLDTMGFATISAGMYSFACLDTGNYLIKAIADTSLYPTSIPTYYSNNPTGVYQWDSALVVAVTTTGINYTGKNIKIIQTPALSGPGMISGQITEGPGFGSRYGNGAQIMGAPLKGVDVKLGKNPGGSAAARTTTDQNGNFTFSNIPLGSYSIYVDVPNFPMDSVRSITLTSGNTTSTNNDYFVDSLKVWVDSVGLGVETAGSLAAGAVIYPNPASDAFVVETNSAETFTAQLYDSRGQLCLTRIFSGTASLDVSGLAEGVYTLNIRNSNRTLTRKLFVIR